MWGTWHWKTTLSSIFYKATSISIMQDNKGKWCEDNGDEDDQPAHHIHTYLYILYMSNMLFYIFVNSFQFSSYSSLSPQSFWADRTRRWSEINMAFDFDDGNKQFKISVTWKESIKWKKAMIIIALLLRGKLDKKY